MTEKWGEEPEGSHHPFVPARHDHQPLAQVFQHHDVPNRLDLLPNRLVTDSRMAISMGLYRSPLAWARLTATQRGALKRGLAPQQVVAFRTPDRY